MPTLKEELLSKLQGFHKEIENLCQSAGEIPILQLKRHNLLVEEFEAFYGHNPQLPEKDTKHPAMWGVCGGSGRPF